MFGVFKMYLTELCNGTISEGAMCLPGYEQAAVGFGMSLKGSVWWWSTFGTGQRVS